MTRSEIRKYYRIYRSRVIKGTIKLFLFVQEAKKNKQSFIHVGIIITNLAIYSAGKSRAEFVTKNDLEYFC